MYQILGMCTKSQDMYQILGICTQVYVPNLGICTQVYVPNPRYMYQILGICTKSQDMYQLQILNVPSLSTAPNPIEAVKVSTPFICLLYRLRVDLEGQKLPQPRCSMRCPIIGRLAIFSYYTLEAISSCQVDRIQSRLWCGFNLANVRFTRHCVLIESFQTVDLC